jgi:hypothetical protein
VQNTPGYPAENQLYYQFINLASGANQAISNSLRSCTTEVQATQSFPVHGHNIILLDTPGSNDTIQGYVDMLDEIVIAEYMKRTYVVFILLFESLMVCSALRRKDYLLEYCTSIISQIRE